MNDWRLRSITQPREDLNSWYYILHEMPKGSARRKKILDFCEDEE